MNSAPLVLCILQSDTPVLPIQLLTMSALALYIPCVYKNITEEMIAQTFYRLKVGSVLHVELVPHTEKYNKAHVFFESLYPFGKGADQIQQVNNGETVKLQYSKSEHVFWLLMLNNREYDGVSRKGWYDVELEEKKKADAEIAAIVANVNAVNTQESVQDQDQIRLGHRVHLLALPTLSTSTLLALPSLSIVLSFA